MAQEKLPKGPARLSDPPSRVSITVTVDPTDPARRMGEMCTRLAKLSWSVRAGVALAAVMTVAAVAAVLLRSGGTNAVTRPANATHRAGAAAVAAAFGYPRLVLGERQLFVPNALLSPGSAGSLGAGAMSGYPVGCVSVGVALHDPRFGRADFDRRFPCLRRHG